MDMPKRIVFDNNDIKDIINLYKTELPSIRAIAKKYGVGHKRIRQLLLDNNVELDPYKNRITHNNTQTIVEGKVKEITPQREGYELIAVCKDTGKEFNDAMNKSGTLTNHIKEHFPDAEIPTNTYQRKKYEMEYGRKWYEEYFDITEKEIKTTRDCGMCDWSTTDLENKTGCFENHIKSEHNTTLEDYLIQFPDDMKLHSKFKTKQLRKKDLSNPKKSVVCKECGQKMKNITNTHLAKHGMTALDYKIKYLNAPLISSELSEVFSKTRKEQNLITPINHTSSGEVAIKEFLESIGVKCEKSRNRCLLDGSEVDLIIPSINMGIEYNGLYWHTEGKGKHWKYHLNKTIKCNNVGYGLLHIFEDEWILKNKLVKEKLRYLVGKSDGKRLGARKCNIKIIKPTIKGFFLDTYHVQGNDKSDIHYGAFYGNILVGVMTFKEKRGMTKGFDNQYELNRFATNYDYIVSGLASKLLKRFIKDYKPESVISFADRRWTLKGDDNMYTKLGFELVDILNPSYTYYNFNMDKYRRLHKFGFGKSSLRKRYPHLDFNKTEYQLAKELGYDRIWDCGLFKYELIP